VAITQLPYRLVVLDVDSTLIENEVIELIAARAGSLDLVAEVTARAMRGELDFAESLRERVATLAGLPAHTLDDVRQEVTVTRGVPELIAGVHAVGGHVGVVSGGFHEVLDPIAIKLGLDFWKANRFEIVDDVLTGRVLGEIVDATAKADALVSWSRDLGLNLEQTVAIGDGANDLQMMAIAGLSVAVDAKPIVNEHADVAISERDLSVVLDLMGLR
jgi:phosphoserine phosphatase